MPNPDKSTRRLGSVIGATVTAALIALPLTQAAAQTVPVQNIDEPRRNPYQQTVQGGFHNFAGFQPVISGVNLYASDLSQQEELPTLPSRSSGNSALSIYGENPELYIDAGNFPYIFVFTNDLAAGITLPAERLRCEPR